MRTEPPARGALIHPPARCALARVR